ncbi:MAG: 16S rRNA (cytidine(1402)-2'-O)-methyltransferase [Cardiobacteriaceae bacterium]|nr:16S rRNA (cytidine(1402)-2'-O)-methyltransferase [Cardiobacteriaceae bacterium]
MAGTLFIVATPIGHLEDFSARAIATLRQVAVIACEDTRVSRRLLDAHAIATPLVALHQHNERGAAEALIARLQGGEDVALISDAGTPLVSDPGATLTRLAHDANITVSPVPGASAVMAALSASGLPGDDFRFAGFVPSRAGERSRFLDTFAASPCTTVMFETPHRIADTLAAMRDLYSGERILVIARELTKQFEQIVRLRIADAPAWLASDANHARGEFVLVLEAAAANHDNHGWQTLADDLREAGVSNRDAASIVARHTGAAKKAVYQYLIAADGENR